MRRTSAGYEPAGALRGVDDLHPKLGQLGPDPVGAGPVAVPTGPLPGFDLLGGSGRELVPGDDLPVQVEAEEAVPRRQEPELLARLDPRPGQLGPDRGGPGGVE